MTEDLTEKQEEVVNLLSQEPLDKHDLAERLEVSPNSVKSRIEAIRDKLGDDAVDYNHSEQAYVLEAEPEDEAEPAAGLDSSTLDDVDADSEPDPDDLTDRERVLVHELQTGATLDELTERVNDRQSVVTQHLRDLKTRGWQVYIDDSAGHIAIEGDHLLRSSEHKGTRTRKANRWWELRHNELVRQFRSLSTPDATMTAESGREDWVTHLTDLHAGDRVRRDDGTTVYETKEIPGIIDYITEQSLSLATKHSSTYDTAHLLWGGDFVTNEGIYEGQYEDLDAWLDEQHDTLVAPLVRQLKAFSESFPTVQVVCMVGNHGQHRANGTSRQANADLILYKHIRNTVAELQAHADLLQNVSFLLGDAKPYRNFPMRGGELTGHLRHGQHRKPQAETSARQNEWRGTLLDHEFDVAYMGHYHISGRIPWDGPPVICTASPKPAGEFVETLGGRTPSEFQNVATVHGVSDEGLTGVYPVDTRHYTRSLGSDSDGSEASA